MRARLGTRGIERLLSGYGIGLRSQLITDAGASLVRIS
jgi:hypothetical protein